MIAFGAADTFGDTIVTYGTSAQNTTALSNAVISSAGINGDVLKFSLDKLDDIAGFAANVGFLAANPDAATKGTTVAATGLVAGAGAQTANAAHAQFLYNTTSGALSFDADGTGANAATAVATLLTTPTLTSTDLLVSL